MSAPREVALIFDLDNTLIHSHIDFLGVRHRLIDLLYEHTATALSREELVRLSLPELVELGQRQDAGLADRMWDVIQEAERQGLQGAPAVEHAPQVLQALRARGYRLALLTNNAREGVAERLGALGLWTFFEVVATRDEVAALKPSPEGIHYVLSHFPGVQHTYLVGDAWIDGRAAAVAGVRFIGFGTKQDAVQARGVHPWAWIIDLRELLQLKLES